MKTKVCKVCGIEKIETEFKKSRLTSAGNVCYKSQCKSCDKIYRQTPKGKYDAYRDSAARKKLEFQLITQDFEDNWNKECYYCGDNIPTIGFDRIDSTKGYIKDNLVLCCTTCNAMKSSFNKDEFIKFCKKISSKHT